MTDLEVFYTQLIREMERIERRQRGTGPVLGRAWITIAPRAWRAPYHRWFRVFFTRHPGTPRWFYRPLAWLYNVWE